MPVVNFSSNRADIPANPVNFRAYDHVANGDMGSDVIGPRPCYLWDTYTGLCLSERESNGYHDSDFYMTVWNEEKQEPYTFCFATTRGWTYPALGSRVDATPEIVAKYRAWGARMQAERKVQERTTKAKKLLELRATVRNVAHENNLPYSRLLKLRRDPKFDRMLALFGSRIRSGFKLSLRRQLVAWLTTASTYDRPFSRKQAEYL